MTDVLLAVGQTILTGVIVGVLMAAYNRKQAKQTAETAEAKATRIENEMMRIDLEVASAQLAYAVAMAIKRGTPNGEIEEGIKQYEKAMDKFRRFERKQMAHTAGE